jgi:hypothetical protein
MKRKVGNKWGISDQLVYLLNKQTTTIMVLVNYFSSYRRHLKFMYDAIDNKWMDIKYVITLVTMTYHRAQHVYTFTSVDAKALHEFVSSK